MKTRAAWLELTSGRWFASLLKRARDVEPTTWVRIFLCLIMTVRHEPWLRNAIEFDTPDSATVEFGVGSLSAVQPAFATPLVPGLDTLLARSEFLVVARRLLTGLLLFGWCVPLSAGLLAAISLGLFFADGFRYLHHLYLLYVSIFYLAVGATVDARAKSKNRSPNATRRPPFGQTLLRAHVVLVYALSGLAKCNPSWFSGETLAALHHLGFAQGPVFEWARSLVGFAWLSWCACGVELAVAALLTRQRTRPLAVFLAIGLHGFIHASMFVSTFGATLLVLLLSFLPSEAERRPGATSEPRRRAAAASNANDLGWLTEHLSRAPVRAAIRIWAPALMVVCVLPLCSALLKTKVGSYSMFTRLVHYRLDAAVDGRIVSRERIAAHLGSEAARVVHLANGRGVGETNVEILERSLPRIAGFLCEIFPKARTTELRLATRRIEGGTLRQTTATSACAAPPRHASR